MDLIEGNSRDFTKTEDTSDLRNEAKQQLKHVKHEAVKYIREKLEKLRASKSKFQSELDEYYKEEVSAANPKKRHNLYERDSQERCSISQSNGTETYVSYALDTSVKNIFSKNQPVQTSSFALSDSQFAESCTNSPEPLTFPICNSTGGDNDNSVIGESMNKGFTETNDCGDLLALDDSQFAESCSDSPEPLAFPICISPDGKSNKSDIGESMNEEFTENNNCGRIVTDMEETFTDVDREKSITTLEGRRIVDIMFLLSQIQSDFHNIGTDCTFMNTEFQNECREGFLSTWTFKCRMCNKITKIRSDNVNSSAMNVNDAAVTGIVSSGNGYAALAELSSALNLPCMSDNTYIRHERKISEAIDSAALASMLQAGAEEKRIAEVEGRIDRDGTPMISVIADGMWPKRSHKTKYDSLSGTASIVGAKTNKVLFIGMRNRRCTICLFAEHKGIQAKPHNCCKNWDKSATSMEADIVVEGFRCSEEMHGVKYNQLIADGDSSVHKKLLEAMPYGPNLLVSKVECKNHLLRNYRTALKTLSKNSKSGFPTRLRKEVSDRTLRLANAVSKASIYRQKEAVTHREKVISLKNDIMNSTYHVFGQHTSCSPYYCKSLTEDKGEHNFVPDMQRCGLWSQLQKLADNLSNHSGSLVHNVTNNQCEVLNNVTAKFLSGKRINYTSRSSFNTRCKSAVVSLNTECEFQRTVHKAMQDGESPGKFTKKFETGKKRRLENNRKRRLQYPIAKKRRMCKGPDEDYGILNDFQEESPEDIEKLKHEFLESLKISEEERNNLQKDTEKQLKSDLWMKTRRDRLSASHHGVVCHMLPTTSCKKQVHFIRYGSYSNTSMQHGIDTEPIAKQALMEHCNIDIKPCGLFIDEEYPFLSATPDGIVSDEVLVEIKCPFTAAQYSTVEEAIAAKKVPYLNISLDGSVTLKCESNYYYQIQSQLRIAKRKMCYFFVYTLPWQKLLKIPADPIFWKEKMAKKLEKFYMNCLLPEIVSPRYGIRFRIEDIRDPDYILAAKRDFAQRNANKSLKRVKK